MDCKRCFSKEWVKSGHIRGQQRYQCKSCGYHYSLGTGHYKSLHDKLIGLHLYISGMSLRAIGAVMHVSHVAVMKWVKTLVPKLCPKVKPEGQVIVMELDEMWHYLKKSPINSGSGRPSPKINSIDFYTAAVSPYRSTH